MAGSANMAILIGTLGADPQNSRTQDGHSISTLSVTTSRRWQDKATGKPRQKTEWHRVTLLHEGLCDFARRHLKKGARVYIKGRLQSRKCQGPGDQEPYSSDMIVRGSNNLVLLRAPAKMKTASPMP